MEKKHMTERENPAPGKAGNGPVYSGDEVRQGEIILRTPARRFIFLGALAGFVLLALAARFFVFA